MTAASDRPAKLARLRALLDERGAPAIALTSPEALAWLFDGARVAVPYGGPAVLRAVVDRHGVVVHAAANEVDRLRDEELGPDLDIRPVPWHAPFPPLPPGVLAESEAAVQLRAARASLLPLERERYRALGADLATAVTRVLQVARPGHSEREVASRLVGATVALGAEPVVVLVGGAARGGLPHPLPTDAPLGRRAVAVVGARRHGLVANLTRWVAFDGAADTDTDAALREVEADAFAATRPGARLGEVLSEIAVAYPRHGFGQDAWLGHHQGGPTGYAGRDPKAVPGLADVVQAGQAFAWNPWVPGAKIEDTVVVDADGIEVLTADPVWPAVAVRGILRPLTLGVDGVE